MFILINFVGPPEAAATLGIGLTLSSARLGLLDSLLSFKAYCFDFFDPLYLPGNWIVLLNWF